MKFDTFFLLLPLVTTDFISEKRKFNAYLLLLPLVTIFLTEKAKIIQIYKITYITDFISKKTKYNV